MILRHTLAAIGSLFLVGCETTQYDTITDQSLTTLLSNVSKYYGTLEATVPNSDACIYSKNEKFWDDSFVSLKTMKLRALYLQDAVRREKYIDNIIDVMKQFQTAYKTQEQQGPSLPQALHPSDFTDIRCLPASQFEVQEQRIEAVIGSAISYEAAVKPEDKK